MTESGKEKQEFWNSKLSKERGGKKKQIQKGFDKTNKIWNQFPDMKHISEQMITS